MSDAERWLALACLWGVCACVVDGLVVAWLRPARAPLWPVRAALVVAAPLTLGVFVALAVVLVLHLGWAVVRGARPWR